MNLQTMTTEERERLAYAEGFTETANLLGQLDDAERERDALQEEIEIVEVDEAEFLAAEGSITYERHTMWANGVNQICLTKGLDV